MQVKFSIPTDNGQRHEVDTGLEFSFEQIKKTYPLGQVIEFATEDGALEIKLCVTGQEFYFRENRALIKLGQLQT